jgi:hypothetical protein
VISNYDTVKNEDKGFVKGFYRIGLKIPGNYPRAGRGGIVMSVRGFVRWGCRTLPENQLLSERSISGGELPLNPVGLRLAMDSIICRVDFS